MTDLSKDAQAEPSLGDEVKDFVLDKGGFFGGLLLMEDIEALLDQNKSILRLNENIEKLAEALDNRPTREELKKRRNVSIALSILAFIVISVVFGNIFHQNMVNKNNCNDRNANAQAFRDLLDEITSISGGYNNNAIVKAFNEYQIRVQPIKC